MRLSSFSRALTLVAVCALSPVCFAQMPQMGIRGGEGDQGGATVDKYGRPITGQIPAGLQVFDQLIPDLLQKFDIPGCSVAVMNNDQIVMMRGYGWADRKAKTPVSPDSLFRLGALSKPITATAIMMLVQDKKLTLDQPVFDLLNDLKPLDGVTPDPRLSKITVRELLQHSGGWNSSTSFDPSDRLQKIADAAQETSPPDRDAIIRYMMGQPLQFDPGTKSVYSNFGYLLLGRVIEKASGMGYEDYVTSKLMTPVGANTFRLGATRLQERDPAEVNYYDYKGAPLTMSVFDTNLVERPYGSVGLEARSSTAGWVASAPDYLRFMGAVDGLPALDDALTSASLTEMVRRPSYALAADSYFGLGWSVRPLTPYDPKKPDDHDPEIKGSWWHEGALPGSSSFVGRDSNRHSFVALFNSHPKDDKAWSDAMQEALYTAISQSKFDDPNAQPLDGNGNGNRDNPQPG